MDEQLRSRGLDGLIAALAERQHGVVSRAQLVALGLDRGAIDHRRKLGRLHTVHRGVYAVGHRVLSRHGRWLAAVLASGPGTVLSHHAGAALLGIRPTARTTVDVTAGRKLHPRPGIHPHCAVLPDDEVTTVNGIPVTTVPRTLLDLASVLPRHALQKAVNEAEVQRLTDPLSLAELVARHPLARGISLISRADPVFTRSDLEDAFLAFLAGTALPRPAVNTIVEGFEVDAAWPAHNLVAELDSYTFHRTRQAFERDRARDRRLQASGWRVIRITWRQLHEDAATLERELSALLRAPPTARRAHPGTPP